MVALYVLSVSWEPKQLFKEHLNQKDEENRKRDASFIRKLEVLVLSYHNFAICQLFAGESIDKVRKSLKNGAVFTKKYLPPENKVRSKLTSLYSIGAKGLESLKTRHSGMNNRQRERKFNEIELPTDDSGVLRRKPNAFKIKNERKSTLRLPDCNETDVLLPFLSLFL